MKTQEIHADKSAVLNPFDPGLSPFSKSWLAQYFNTSTRSKIEPSEPKLFTAQDRKARKKRNKAARASRRRNRK